MVTDRLQELCDERDVQRALNLFARAMDERDWAAMAEILDETRRVIWGQGGGREGRRSST